MQLALFCKAQVVLPAASLSVTRLLWNILNRSLLNTQEMFIVSNLLNDQASKNLAYD